MRSHNGDFPQWIGRLSYLVNTMASDELAMRVARASATMELVRWSWIIPIPATLFQCVCKCSLAYTHFALRPILDFYLFYGCHIYWLFDISIIIIKSSATFDDTYYQQLTRVRICDLAQVNNLNVLFSICYVLCMITMITKCEIQLDDKNQHSTKPRISEGSAFDRRFKCSSIEPKEKLTHWWSNVFRSETAFCHKIFRLLPDNGSWNASFRISVISTMWEGSSVKCHDCPLLSSEKYLDTLRKIARQII